MFGELKTHPEGNTHSTLQGYSRIDYFLVDSKLIPFTYNLKYHNIIISDHATLTFMIELSGMTEKQTQWRLNPQILNDKACYEYLITQINMFFETNDYPETPASLLWETFKTFIGGALISTQAFRNKENRAKQHVLEREIRQLDMENAIAPCTIIHNKIAAFKYKLNQIYSDQIIKLDQNTKQLHFEFGDKPQKLLARQLRKQEGEKTIYKIKSDTEQILTLPKVVNDRFSQYYQTLYST